MNVCVVSLLSPINITIAILAFVCSFTIHVQALSLHVQPCILSLSPPPPFLQEKRARFYVFHKALRHGVIIDFENLDDPTTKYLQFP